jgi:hypothetical protein
MLKPASTPIFLDNQRVVLEGPVAGLVHEPEASVESDPARQLTLREVLAERFSSPTGFPPIASTMIPDDRIAIAVACGTPRASEIADLIAEMLVRDGHPEDMITIVVPRSVGDSGLSGVHRHEIYDPEVDGDSAWLMAGVDDQPIKVSRLLFDADVVIAVSTFDGVNPRDAICPAFCARSTQQHLSKIRPVEASATISMISDQLGVFWEVVVLPGPGDSISDVLVGDRRSVLLKGIEHMERFWGVELENPFPLVIATIESLPAASAEAACAALLAAEKVVSEGGAIVLVANFEKIPHPLSRAVSEKPGTFYPELQRVRESFPVYHCGEPIRPDDEEFGLARIADSREMTTLIQRSGSAVLLRDAHKLDARLSARRA